MVLGRGPENVKTKYIFLIVDHDGRAAYVIAESFLDAAQMAEQHFDGRARSVKRWARVEDVAIGAASPMAEAA